MHFVKHVKYLSEYKLLLTLGDGNLRQVDLAPHLNGEMFEPLKDIGNFKSVHLNSDLDTNRLEERRRHVPGFSL